MIYFIAGPCEATMAYNEWLKAKIDKIHRIHGKHPEDYWVRGLVDGYKEAYARLFIYPRKYEFVEQARAAGFPEPKSLFRIAQRSLIEDFGPYIERAVEIDKRIKPFDPFCSIQVVAVLESTPLKDITYKFLQEFKDNQPCLFKHNIPEGVR